MNNKKGSSETTREASVFYLNPFYKNSFINRTPPSSAFLEWFIGFTEGDGSFALAKFPTKKNPNNKRPVFVINQKEPQVLYKIKKSFGYGTVIEISDQGQRIYRYRVAKIEHITHLIHLFYCNCILKKTTNRFIEWVKSYNELCYQRKGKLHLKHYSPFDLQRQVQLSGASCRLSKLNLETAWLSGFTDAEGGFYAALLWKTRTSKSRFAEKYLRLSLKFYLKQKGERDVLEKIVTIIKQPLPCKYRVPKAFTSQEADTREKIGVSKVKGKVDIYCLEITSKIDRQKLLEYFDSYVLLSRTKRLVYVRWKRLCNRAVPCPDESKAFKRYKRLVQSVAQVGASC